jgi:hypothetical protein
MARTRMNTTHTKIIIFLSKQEKELLIQDMNHCITEMRKNVQNDCLTELEVMETIRFLIRGARDTEEKQAEMLCFQMGTVEAFYYMQILQKSLALDDNDSTGFTEQRNRISLLIKQINELIMKIIGNEQFNEVKQANQYSVNYLYIQYLNYQYEHMKTNQSAYSSGAELLLTFCKQIMVGAPVQANLDILLYPIFQGRCEAWMRKHQTDYICLDEIIADQFFMMR